MILLDTDHISILEVPGSDRRARLVTRLALATDEVVGTTIITIEEQMRGWLVSLAKERLPRRQVGAYRRLAGLFEFFRPFHIALFDEAAATLYETFGSVHIGAMDRKIAAIAIANKALLLTANKKDFEQIPGLRFENWMDEPPATTAGPAPPA
jgi:tRNA(fMet)-specific endonuclease VapC